jgi:hypothetical protein
MLVRSSRPVRCLRERGNIHFMLGHRPDSDSLRLIPVKVHVDHARQAPPQVQAASAGAAQAVSRAPGRQHPAHAVTNSPSQQREHRGRRLFRPRKQSVSDCPLPRRLAIPPPAESHTSASTAGGPGSTARPGPNRIAGFDWAADKPPDFSMVSARGGLGQARGRSEGGRERRSERVG